MSGFSSECEVKNKSLNVTRFVMYRKEYEDDFGTL